MQLFCNPVPDSRVHIEANMAAQDFDIVHVGVIATLD